MNLDEHLETRRMRSCLRWLRARRFRVALRCLPLLLVVMLYESEPAVASPAVSSIAVTPTAESRALITLTASEGVAVGAFHFSMGGADDTTCHFWYQPGNATLYLASAIGAGSVPLGASISIANNQCIVSGVGSSAQIVDGRLIVVVAVEFTPSFQGTKPLYGSVQNNSDWAPTPWMQFGSWTIGPPPSPAISSITVAPNGGNRVLITLTATAGTAVGALHFSMGGADAVTCHFWYQPGNNSLYLAAAIGADSVASGAAGSTANNQCIISGIGSSAQLVDGRLVVVVAVEFMPSFNGSKPLYGSVQNNFNWVATPWAQFGSWAIGPAVVSITVAPNGENRVIVTLTASEGAVVGAFHFSMGGADAATCHFWYAPGNNTLYLAAATGADSVVAGASGSIANNQCMVSGVGSNAQLAGDHLVVVVAVEFMPSFQGNKPLYGSVQNNYNWVATPWAQFGSWTIGTPPSPEVLSSTVTPNGGSRVLIRLTTTQGAAVGALHFSMGGADATTCHFWYTPGNNTLYLAAAIGANSVLVGTSGSIANDQCVVSGSGSGAQLVDGQLILVVAIEFRSSFQGNKPLYGSVQNNFDWAATPWKVFGSWTVPFGPGSSGSNSAYIPNSWSTTVSVLDLVTNTVIGDPITVGANPNAAAVTPDGRKVYVTTDSLNSVSVIDTATNSVVGGPIAVGVSPLGLAVTPNGARVYVANGSHGEMGTVSVIDTATDTVMGSPIAVGRFPACVAVHPSGAWVYVTNIFSDSVSVISTATNSVVTSISVGRQPRDLVVSPDGTRLYVSNTNPPGPSSVSVIDTATHSVIGNTITFGSSPHINVGGLAILPDGSRIYAATNGEGFGKVYIVSTSTNSLVGSPIIVGLNPDGIAVKRDGKRIYVLNFSSNTVSVIDTETNAIVGNPIPVGQGPRSLGIFVQP